MTSQSRKIRRAINFADASNNTVFVYGIIAVQLGGHFAGIFPR